MKDFNLSTAPVALVAATPKTALQILAGANEPVEIPFFDVSFDGISPTDRPVLVQVLRQTTAIGGSPTAVTPVEVPNADPGALAVTAASSAGGTEPTSSDVYWSGYLHPQTRQIIARPSGKPFRIVAGERLGLAFTAPNNVNVIVSNFGTE